MGKQGTHLSHRAGIDHLALHRGYYLCFFASSSSELYEWSFEWVHRIQPRVANRNRKVRHREPHGRFVVLRENLFHYGIALSPENALAAPRPRLVHRRDRGKHGEAEPC